MNDNNSITPRWIRLKEATQYAKIGKKRLIDLAQSGVIKGAQDQDNKRYDWIFDRLSIDAYREVQMSINEDREIARKILDSINNRSKR